MSFIWKQILKEKFINFVDTCLNHTCLNHTCLNHTCLNQAYYHLRYKFTNFVDTCLNQAYYHPRYNCGHRSGEQQT